MYGKRLKLVSWRLGQCLCRLPWALDVLILSHGLCILQKTQVVTELLSCRSSHFLESLSPSITSLRTYKTTTDDGKTIWGYCDSKIRILCRSYSSVAKRYVAHHYPMFWDTGFEYELLGISIADVEDILLAPREDNNRKKTSRIWHERPS